MTRIIEAIRALSLECFKTAGTGATIETIFVSDKLFTAIMSELGAKLIYERHLDGTVDEDTIIITGPVNSLWVSKLKDKPGAERARDF